ncbi:MAG: glycerophosphodiester phosphodiesterase [Eubacterium sp.]|nr:glycerophosphodiester phosphodiesterase [Eubacterium sp.]
MSNALRHLKRIIIVSLLFALSQHIFALSTQAALTSVSKLKLTRINGSAIQLKWTKDTSCDGYYLYRLNESGNNFRLIKTIKNSKTNFYTDTNVNANYPQQYAIKKYTKSKNGAISKSSATKTSWQGADKTCYIAHRGARDIAPENTMIAFKKAKEEGYNAFECDVWYTDSKQFLISHDYDLVRQCGLNKPVTALTKTTRKKYPIILPMSEKYPVQYLPSLEEVLSYASKSGMNVYLHYRTKQSHHPAAALKKTAKLIKKYKMQKKAVFFTSNVWDLNYISTFGLQTGYLTKAPTAAKRKAVAKKLVKYKCSVIIFPFRSESAMSKGLISYCHKLGLRTLNYGVTSPKQVRYLMDSRSDGWISNYPVFVE